MKLRWKIICYDGIMISYFANKRKKKDQIGRAKKLTQKRDKNKHGLREYGEVLIFGSKRARAQFGRRARFWS